LIWIIISSFGFSSPSWQSDSTTPDEAATVVEKEIYTQKCLGWINKRTHILKSMVDYESEQITLKLCVIWKSL
jgi:hypothetical protein